MELRGARCFVTVADCGSVTEAAIRMRTAQPSLSRQLQRFERDLGLQLFDRRDRRLMLTAAGRRFLPIARDLVTRADLAREAAAALRQGALASAVLCTTRTTLTDVIAPFLATWGLSDPVPTAWEELPSEIYRSLGLGADLAIGTQQPPVHLAHLTMAVLPVWAYVQEADRWASRRSVSVAELVERRLLVLGPGQHARIALDRALAEANLALGPFIEFEAPEVAQAVAAAGRGVAVVSDDRRFDLAPIAITGSAGPVVVRLHAAWRRDHHASATLEEIAHRLAGFSRARYGASASE